MLTAYVVPYRDGDIEDENHVRVEHWGIDLSGRDVLLVEADPRVWGYRVDQRPREIRCVSGMHGRVDGPGCSILLHLKPLPKKEVPRLRCRDLDTMFFLKIVRDTDRIPLQAEILFYQTEISQPVGQRLIFRKFRKLINRGHIDGSEARARLTNKGIRILSQMLAGDYIA